MSNNDATKELYSENLIKGFDNYVEEKGYPYENFLSSLSTIVLVGYFLKVHSKDPQMAVLRYLNSNTISYKKSKEVKMILNALKAR